jgi:hypothetical protein
MVALDKGGEIAFITNARTNSRKLKYRDSEEVKIWYDDAI